ncbi:flagellar biosynthesis protein FlhF [Caldicellulosiruptoraceae bacterium PP1]
MKIRRYIANDMQEAMIRIKSELGKDAVILSTKKIKQKGLLGFFKKPLIEVTAAFEEKNPYPLEKSYNKDIQDKKEETEDLKNIDKIEKRIEEIERLILNISKEITETPQANQAKKKGFIDIAKQNLKKNGVEEEIIEDIIKEIDSSQSINNIINSLYKNIKNKLEPVEILDTKADKKPYVIFFVGPTGVGKTTTIAKIAAKLIYEYDKTVAFITADTYRIAAVEQLKTYAEIMSIKTKVWYDANEYPQIIDELKDFDYILVDTAGRSHKNDQHMDELKNFIEIAIPNQIYLLLNITTSPNILKDIIDKYSFLNHYNIIITKIDECSSYGNILNIKYFTKKPISYVTTGQNVPDDIQEFDAEKFSKLIMGSQSV